MSTIYVFFFTLLICEVLRVVSGKVVSRVSLYRRLLHAMRTAGKLTVYSHELAKAADSTAAQVRRDLMEIGCAGSTTTGYSVEALIAQIGAFLDVRGGQEVALVGLGHLGRAILDFFSGRHGNLRITAAFDNDSRKTGRVIHGCRCYPMEELAERLAAKDTCVAILAVPGGSAQSAAEALVKAGITGILNFAPVPLYVPRHVYVEDSDMTTSLEKVAFFAHADHSCIEETP